MLGVGLIIYSSELVNHFYVWDVPLYGTLGKMVTNLESTIPPGGPGFICNDVVRVCDFAWNWNQSLQIESGNISVSMMVVSSPSQNL